MEQRFAIAAKAEHIEAVYFKNHAYDVFRSPTTRNVRRGFLWVTGCGLAFVLYAQHLPNSIGMIALAVTAMIGQTLLLVITFRNLNKGRQRIIAFARDTERGGTALLRLTEQGFSLTFGGAEHIERWSQVQHAVLAEDHILIRTLTTFFFPKASMQADDFATLTALIRQHTLLPEGPEEREAARTTGTPA